MSGKSPSPEFVLAYVAGEFDVPIEVVAEGRGRGYSAPARHLAMWLMHSFGDNPYVRIASAMNLKTPSAVYHGLRCIRDRMNRDDRFRDGVQVLKQTIISDWQQFRTRPDRPLPPRPAVKQKPFRDRFPPKPSSTDIRRRPCLKCGNDFNSTHVGNRICQSCSEQNRRVPPGMEMAV